MDTLLKNMIFLNMDTQKLKMTPDVPTLFEDTFGNGKKNNKLEMQLELKNGNKGTNNKQ